MNQSSYRFRAAIVAFLLAGAPAVLAEQPVAPLTLQAAVDEAFAARPALKGAAAGQAAADARLAEARAGRYPAVTLGERLTNSNNPVFVFGTLLEQGRLGPDNLRINAFNAPDPTTNFRSQVDVRVPLFDGRQTATRSAQARLGRARADAEREIAEQRVRFEVVRAYYGVLVATSATEVAADAVATAEADATRARARVEAGLIVASDLLAVEVQLAEFRQQQIRATGDLASAYAALDAAMGVPPGARPVLAGEPGRRTFDAPALDELLRAGVARRPDVLALELEIRTHEESVRAARGEYLPRVDAFASAGSSGDKLTNGSGDYAVGVAVTYTLFDAGRRPRIDAALAARDAAVADRDERVNQVRLEIVRAYEDFVAAREQTKVAEKAVDEAVETHRIVRDRYDAGLTPVTEVLRSETALVRARLNHLNARYAFAVGYAGLLLAAGELTSVAPFTE
jgi:outer membrane protein TolC